MKKKTLTIAIALVLVVALAVGATWAYLTAQSGPVVNTFTVGKLFDQGGALTLKEHKAVAQTSGEYSYKVNTEEVTGNEYNLLPGTKIEKDPFVKVTGLKAGASCYLYVEVVASDASSVLNYSVADTWATPAPRSRGFPLPFLLWQATKGRAMEGSEWPCKL